MKKFSLRPLLPGELSGFTQRILAYLESFIADEPVVKIVYDRIARFLVDLQNALSRDKKSAYTERLLEKDMLRDNAFIRFRDYCNSFLKDPDPSKSASARAIMALVRRIGFSLHSQSYLRQTDAMTRLIADLKKPEMQAHATNLQAESHVELMETAAAEFEAVRQEKVDVETAEEYERVYNVFRNLNNDIQTLIYFLDLLKEEGYKPETLPGIMSSVEQEITDVLAVARARETREENMEEGEE